MPIRALSVALLVVGVVLLILAAFSGDSLSNGFSKLFRGEPDSKTLILLIGGAAAATFGLVGVLRPAR